MLFSVLALEFVGVSAFFAVLALNEEVEELGSEFGARDDTFFASCLSNTDINSSFESRFLVVTGENSGVGARFVEVVDRCNDTFSEWVDETNGSDECKLALDSLSGLLSLELVTLLVELVELVLVEVSDGEGEWLLGFLGNVGGDNGFEVVVSCITIAFELVRVVA